ncbi:MULTISPECIES: hypothetical protein [Vibrio]|jgi:hypothetical protein|uniref:Uncharacterized protein n=1 Tax=Vibrio jasicida TaxID=766224 RepID=A0AAU9QIW8_9VIBR|nr:MULTISPECIES: hypothetical protein [Vibrio]KIP66253.1 hypothetical protein SN11_22880 [Vibrio harveyi]KIP71942.1 hypothetical protein SN10_12740 [Vibrio harveyi]MCF6450030.1 hypothetical protein [Vibrio sp. MMG023]MCX2789071.1 hypothetical protein [Vibrio sp. Sgm 5]NOJ19644.1 hypothetical protein [Vibrio jasicida]
MNTNHFKDLIDSLKDLTPTQKKYLISKTRLSLEQSDILQKKDLLTPEELEALLAPMPTTNTK